MTVRAARVAGLIVLVAMLMVAGSALGDPVAGATYTATAADGASVSFTVSPDGTLLTAYRITDAPAQGCQFYGNGQQGDWEGAPIQDNHFAYQLGNAISFQGTFTGANTASGTFRFQDPPSGGSAACDSGTVAWTATTGSGSAGGPGGSSSGGGTGGAGGSGGGGAGTSGGSAGGSTDGSKTPSHGAHAYLTRLVLHVLGRRGLGGRVGSSLAACRARRPVILWVGQHRLARSRADRTGAYVFRRSPAWRGHLVRVSVAAARTSTGATCAPASSTFIHG